MKTLFILIVLLLGLTIEAQVGINKSNLTASSILDFGSETGTTVDGSDAKGILLSPTDGLPAGPTAGTIAFVVEAGGASFRYFNGTAWSTATPGGFGTPMSGTDGNGVIIGDSSSSADGVLILESPTHALVLPQISGGRFTLSPTPGLMYYDTSDDSVYVYNGSAWIAY